MTIPSIEELQEAAISIVVQARKNKTLGDLTPRTIREQIEERYGLEKGCLDEKEYRRPIKDAMNVAKTNSTSITPSVPTSNSKYKSAEFILTSDMEQDEADTRDSDNDVEKLTMKGREVVDSGDTEREKATAKKRKKLDSETSSSSKRPSSPTAVESDADSDAVSGPLQLKKQKTTAEKKKSKATGEKKVTKKTTEVLSKDEATIKRLKGFVNACGVRKVWSKLFAGIEDKPSKQIKILREILTELGMSSRPSMEQAKAIKEKRDLASELEDVQKFEKAMMNQSSRKTRKAVEEGEEEESSDKEETRPTKRKTTARQSIMAFLGDQSDSD